MVGKGIAELSAGCCKCIVESVVWIVHLIHSEDCFQATLVETGIVGYKRNSSYLVPDVIYILHVREEYIGNPFL